MSILSDRGPGGGFLPEPAPAAADATGHCVLSDCDLSGDF